MLLLEGMCSVCKLKLVLSANYHLTHTMAELQRMQCAVAKIEQHLRREVAEACGEHGHICDYLVEKYPDKMHLRSQVFEMLPLIADKDQLPY